MARPTESDSTTPQTLPATANNRPHRIACVASTYHADLVNEMVRSARSTLLAAGLAPEDFLRIDAPGAYELPIVAQRLAHRDDIDAVLTFGLVLKGETDHDLHIAGAVSRALLDVSLASGTPVLFGVLTCGTLDQARARARLASDGGLDKGREVARAAIAVLHSIRSADQGAPNGAHSLEEIG